MRRLLSISFQEIKCFGQTNGMFPVGGLKQTSAEIIEGPRSQSGIARAFQLATEESFGVAVAAHVKQGDRVIVRHSTRIAAALARSGVKAYRFFKASSLK